MKYTITLNTWTDGASTSISDGLVPIVASQVDSSATDSFSPYRTTTDQSTWPVWYDSIKASMSFALDNVSAGSGDLKSYTNKVLGQKDSRNYYKSSSVTFVDAYDYTYNGGLNQLLTGEISPANAKKVMGLGDKLISDVDSSGNITWTSGNVNYGSGIKKVQVGSPDSTTEGNNGGAIFNIYSFSGSQSKTVYVNGKAVGYATVTKTNRARVVVETFMYTNASVTTTVWDYGGDTSSVSTTINYSGIDTHNPNALSLETSEKFATTDSSVVDNLSSLNWWRTYEFANDTAYDDDDYDDEEISPYVWFYRVDRGDTLADLLAISARTYANYDAINSDRAWMKPIAVGSFDSFVYDFAQGGAIPQGLNYSFVYDADTDKWTFDGFDIDLADWGITAPDSPSDGDVITCPVIHGGVDGASVSTSGYYRFTFYVVDLAGNMGTTTTYYVKADYDTPTFDMHIEFKDGGVSQVITDTGDDGLGYFANGTWATGETAIRVYFSDPLSSKSYVNSNGTNISGNTLVFEAGSDTFGVVFDKDQIIALLVGSTRYPVGGLSATFAKQVETDASKATLKVEYDKDDGELKFTFTDEKVNGKYPDIDWTTEFYMYSGQDYENDGEVYATDGWFGGVKIRVDRNIPDTPEIADDGGDFIKTINVKSSPSTSVDKANRTWFTTSGLRLDTLLTFADDLAELYSSEVRVYFGLKNVTSDADFASLTYFANNYKYLSIDEYSNYFDNAHLFYIDGGNLDGSETSMTIPLVQTDGVGMRVILVWAIDQAGNISDGISAYYVLADETTYTINSGVKTNANLASGSATIEQTNAEEDTTVSFKRGETVTFNIEMDTEVYAPYRFTMTAGSTVTLLSNYTPNASWNMNAAYEDNVSVSGGSLVINYVLDDFSTVGALDTVAGTKKINFEFAHRKIVEYTVTNSTSVPFTYEPTVVEMSTDNSARSHFVYYYLDNDGNVFDLDGSNVPIYPNADEENYFVAIYIPSSDESFVVKHAHNVPTDTEGAGDVTLSGGVYYFNVGYQVVEFIPYTIIKGNVTITAVASSSTYKDDVTLDYLLSGLDKDTAVSNGLVVGLKLNTSVVDYTELDIGSYQIIQDGDAYVEAGHENFLQYYNVNYISAFHTIYRREIKIYTVAAEKIYGEADPDFKFSVTLDQFGGDTDAEKEAALIAFFASFGEPTNVGDVYTFSSNGVIRRDQSSDTAGEYSFVVNSASFDINMNYTLDVVNTAKFTINKRAVVLTVGGQFAVKQASDDFDPTVDFASIIPTFTLSQADARFEDVIYGALALEYVGDDGATSEYDHQYKYTIVLGTISNSSMTFSLSSDKDFFVYVVAADAVVIKLAVGEQISFVFGTTWTAKSVPYSEDLFVGLDDEHTYVVDWDAVIDGVATGSMPNVGSYLVEIQNVTVTQDGTPLTKVFVEPFSITITPAVVGVRPTYTGLVKAYGAQDSVFGIGWEIVSINGEAVGTEYAGYAVADIKNAISGSFGRALFANGTFEALGTRYDDASNAQGVLYSNANKYYAFSVNTDFVSGNQNFKVDSGLSLEDAALRFEITRCEIEIDNTMFVGVSKYADGSTSVNYPEGTTPVEFKELLVLSSDDVQLAYDAAYDAVEVGDRTITFTNMGLAGAKAANYTLVVKVGGNEVDSVTIAYVNNAVDPSLTKHIRINYGLIGLHKSDVTIVKQYDGTNSLDISSVSINPYTDGGVGTTTLVNIMKNGKASVLEESDQFSDSKVGNYTLTVELFFEVDDASILQDIWDYNEPDVVIGGTTISNKNGIRIKITSMPAEIERRIINSASFATISPVARDYNARGDVEVGFVFADGAIVAGDEVTLKLNGNITDGNYDAGMDHPIEILASSSVSNANYRVDVDELNATYNSANPLKVHINPAKLIPNVAFVSRAYDGTTDVATTAKADGTDNDFTTLNYSSYLTSELEQILFGSGTLEFKLSNEGEENENVIVDQNGDVHPHNVLVKGLTVKLADVATAKLANYEVYGVRYVSGEFSYRAVGSIPATAETVAIDDYEILEAVNITRKLISIVENDINVHDKVYDGTKVASATIDVDAHPDVVAKDKPYLAISASGEFEQKNVSYSGINVRIYGVAIRAIDSEHRYLLDNYDISGTSGLTISRKIYPRPVTVSFELGSRTYSGDAYVSTNVVRPTIEGLLDIDVKSYGVQSGSAYYADKNVAFAEDENGDYKLETGIYVLLTESEKASYDGSYLRYSIGRKQGTVYDPVIKSTKSAYTNYVLSYAVDAADYDGSDYLVCEANDGTMRYFGDSYIVDSEIKTYYYELKTTDKYILASDTTKLAAASEEDIVGSYVYAGKNVYLVVGDYAGEVSGTLPAPVSYSKDAYGKIQKRAAIIKDVKKIDTSTAFTKDYDGTTKFYGVADVDFTYSDGNIGLADDDLTIEGVDAEFESASVGDTYVIIKADRLGGADANNYTYGTLRSARIPARINKIQITASLADDTMVYGTNLSNVEGDVTYTLGGYDLKITTSGVMVKFKEFLTAVGIIASVDDDIDVDDVRYMTDILGRTYDLVDGNYVLVDYISTGNVGEYVLLGGRFNSYPKANAVFSTARPTAGTESLSYTLKGGEAANFAFVPEYTGNGSDGSSLLRVAKKDLFVVAVVDDYQKEYGKSEPMINLNYLDSNGRSGIVSGETWRNIFVVGNVDYRPSVYFSEYGSTDAITAISRVNDPNYTGDNRFDGNYVLNIVQNGTYEAANYEVHYGQIVLVDATAEKNDRYVYTFEGSEFVARVPVPELTIVMPSISGVSLASKDGEAYQTTYNRSSQAGVALTGVKDTDTVTMIDANGHDLGATDAGSYEGIVVLERPVMATEDDPNGYKLSWRSDVDGGVATVKLEIAKASPGLSAPRDSITYDGKEHTYSYSRASVAGGLPTNASRFTTRYTKKVAGNYVEVDSMIDAGTYLVYLTYNSGNTNYEVQTIEIQFAIIKASVIVELDYTERQYFEANKEYSVDYLIKSITPTTTPALISKDDLMVQFLLAGEPLLAVEEDGSVKSLDESIIRLSNGNYVFGISGRYPFQIILKDSALKDNFDIKRTAQEEGKIATAVAGGALELVVNHLDYVKESDVKASITVNSTGDPSVEEALLADKFEARYVYQHNVLADDDAYYAAVDEYFMAEIEKALNTSVAISAIVRLNLTLAGNRVALSEAPVTISVELTQDILDSLGSTVIYQTVLNSDGTTALKKLNEYEIKDGVLTYTTNSLGSIVFVKVGRETPMLAIWIVVGVAGGAAVIVAITGAYIAMKKRRLKRELLD